MGSISARGTDDDRLFAVADGDVIPEEMSETDVVPTIKAELPSFKAFDYFSQCFGVLVRFFLLFGHTGSP